MTGGSYQARRITLTFQLGTGVFGETGTDTITVGGLRTSVSINKEGGGALSALTMRVLGLSLQKMNELTALSREVMVQRRNTVIVQAGSSRDPNPPVVFSGTIQQAWADLQGMPDAMLYVEALNPSLAQVKPVPPKSYQGTVPVSTIMASLAEQMGLGFENNGVETTLNAPYFYGDAVQQARACADAANINFSPDDNVLAIWPKGSSRGGAVPLISPGSGLAGYPAYNGTGITFRTLFNPAIRHGGTIMVESSLKPACGRWFVSSLTHQLDANFPGGGWFSVVSGYPLYGNSGGGVTP